MKARLSLLAAASLLLSQLPSLQAQTQLIPWNHSWNYMHPTGGVLPAGSGATEPNSGATKWYATQTDFNASYAGPSFTTAGAGYNAGLGQGPIGYGGVDYFGNPLPPPAEFTALATTLTTPASGSRRTGYFRTTFTVPNDGNFYVNPQIRYMLDDGAFVYLDGVLVLRVNLPGGSTDTYTQIGANATNTESHIRTADLSLVAGSTTGGNTAVTPAIPGNATVVQRLTSLTPGVHTLAISVHNANAAADSTDLLLAVQLVSTPTNIAIAATASNVTRNLNGTPTDPSDDLINFTMNVSSSGAVSPSWVISGPAGSSVVGKSGAYNTNVAITNISIGEFAAGPLAIVVEDSVTAAATSNVTLFPQRIIGIDNHTGLDVPITTSGTIPNGGWVFDDNTRVVRMNNGGGGTRKVYQSQVIDLSAAPAVQFSGILEVVDGTTGTEATDSFVAYLIIDGNVASPVNLILPHDTLVPDGVLSDDELAPAGGTFVRPLSYVIPASANSVQLVVEGVNDSANETLIVRDFLISNAPPTIQALAGVVTVNNLATDDASDDTFGAPVTIQGINLGASTGWTSDTVPASGLYAAPQPVTFQNYLVSGGPKTFTLTDSLNAGASTQVTLTPPARTLTVSAATNIVRHENGPGLADDTVTFTATIGGTNGGPGWRTNTPGVTPSTGNFGTIAFTVSAPLPASPLAVIIEDVSYPATTQTINVALPGRYIIGQTNFGAGVADLMSDINTPPAPDWINDSLARTLEMNNGATPDKVVTSDLINLSAIGQVAFSATFRAIDTSTGSNMDTPDKFKAELVYQVAGVPTTINLISAWDTGDGAPTTTGTTGGLNGAPDGYLNGYTGAAGTDLRNATVYAAGIDDYNANRERDEFNRNLQTGDVSYDNAFNLSAVIPANADNVRLIITGVAVGAATPTERFIVSDVLFTTSTGPVDTDNDGMTDAYEDANGLDKNNPADANLDKDGDGKSNIVEFLSGTAANNPASSLKIVAYSKVGMISNVTWTSVPGKIYRIDVSPDLINWIDVGLDYPAAASPATTTSSGPLDQTPFGNPVRLFLRVRVKP